MDGSENRFGPLVDELQVPAIYHQDAVQPGLHAAVRIARSADVEQRFNRMGDAAGDCSLDFGRGGIVARALRSVAVPSQTAEAAEARLSEGYETKDWYFSTRAL